jgi:hypothetical protein
VPAERVAEAAARAVVDLAGVFFETDFLVVFLVAGFRAVVFLAAVFFAVGFRTFFLAPAARVILRAAPLLVVFLDDFAVFLAEVFFRELPDLDEDVLRVGLTVWIPPGARWAADRRAVVRHPVLGGGTIAQA